MREQVLICLLLTISSVAASPIVHHGNVGRSSDAVVHMGARPEHRTAVVVMGIIYTFLLALAQGYRAGRMAGSKSETRVSDVLVFAQGFLSTGFVLAVCVKSAGLGLATEAQCRGAIWLCIVLYGLAKMTQYMFLIERVHVVRAPFVDRKHDSIYIFGAISTVGGYAAIMVYQFDNPTAKLSRTTGLCTIGVQPDAAIAIMVFDNVVNIAMIALFIWQLRPAMKASPRQSLWYTHRVRGEQPLSKLRVCCMGIAKAADLRRLSMRDNVRVMLIRNIIGSSLLLVITAANNIFFLTLPSAKMSHVCLLACMSDVALSMLITHWLTMRSPKDNDESSRSSFITPNLACSETIDGLYLQPHHAALGRVIGGGAVSLQSGDYDPSIGPTESKVFQTSAHLNPR